MSKSGGDDHQPRGWDATVLLPADRRRRRLTPRHIRSASKGTRRSSSARVMRVALPANVAITMRELETLELLLERAVARFGRSND
jgi:hypothetical protein